MPGARRCLRIACLAASIAAGLTLAACGGEHGRAPEPTAVAPSTPAAPVPPAVSAPTVAAPDPVIPVLDPAPAFVFYEDVDREVPAVFGSVGAGPEHTLAIVGDERRYVARRDGSAIVLERRARDGAVRWSQRLAVVATGAPVVASRLGGDGTDQVIVAAPVEGGYTIETRAAADGAPVWQSTVRAPGPSAVQLSIEPTRVLVFARAEGADLVDALDLGGHHLGRATMPHAISRASTAAPESATRDLPPGYRLRCPTRGRAGCALDRGHEGIAALPAPFGCSRIALTELEDGVVFADWCPASTGVAIRRYGADHAERWVTSPHGIGSIGHSAYSNEVAIAIEGEHLRVWGHESGGDYVSTLDLASGRELATIARRR